MGYYLKFPGDPPLCGTWLVSLPTIVLAGTISGLSIGVSIAGGIVLSRRKWGTRTAPIIGASLGAVVGGILPSAIGVLGFGSLNEPYAGTGLAATTVFIAALLLGTLLSLPGATGQTTPISGRASLGCSALASILVVVPFGLTVSGIVTTALPMEGIWHLQSLIEQTLGGGVLFVQSVLALGLTLLAGIVVGTFIGLTAELATILRTTWATMSRMRRRNTC